MWIVITIAVVAALAIGAGIGWFLGSRFGSDLSEDTLRALVREANSALGHFNGFILGTQTTLCYLASLDRSRARIEHERLLLTRNAHNTARTSLIRTCRRHGLENEVTVEPIGELLLEESRS